MVSGRIAQAIEAKRAAPSREMDLLPPEEEKFDDLDLDLIGHKSNSKTQRSVISKEKDDTPALDKSFKH